MKRIAHVVVAGEIGGAEHMLKSLAAKHDGAFDHVICVLSPLAELPGFFESAGIRVRDGGRIREDPIAFLRRSLGKREVGWLTSILREERADLVHLHTFGSQVVGTRAAKRLSLPLVRTEHSTRVFDDRSCWPFSRWSLVRVDASVAISEHVRSVAVARAPFVASKIAVVPNGVDTERFVPSARERPDEEPFTFVVVARLEPRKGVDRAVRALAATQDARLAIVGDGEERRSLEALTRELGLSERVTFHGYITDPRPILARADAVVAPSRKEGLGLAFLEAMAAGLPLACVPVGGLVEIVKSGETGLLATSEREHDLAAVMNALANDRSRARAFDRAARADVEARYSLASMRARYASVYSRVLAR